MLCHSILKCRCPRSTFSIRYKDAFIIFLFLSFSILYLPMLLYVFFPTICIGNICCLCELSENQLCWLLMPFFDLNYRKFNIIFSRLTKHGVKSRAFTK